ncbi:hypothetical protein NUACC26_028830 [Scytonema sp. NUACC26]
MPPKRNHSVFVQIVDLFLMELTNWRWSWQTIILTSTVTPILGIIALGSFARGTGQEAQVYILTGNLVMSLMFGNLGNVSSRFSYMRFAGTLDYYATLPIRREASVQMGAPAKSFRMALGALIIKEKLGISDRETVEQFKENPYLQYFIGMSSYSNEAPFDASMLVHFRERIRDELVNKVNQQMVKKMLEATSSQRLKKKQNYQKKKRIHRKIGEN